MSQSSIEQQKRAAAASAAQQQSDNIAHALAGAGGGILSMVLTCATIAPSCILSGLLTLGLWQLSSDYSLNESAG